MAAMWIMVAGPYRAGGVDALTRAKNLTALNAAALAVWEKGHVPVIGVNMALPMIAEAGQERYDDLMAPLSLALAERCDAVLRIGGASGGASGGADREVDLIHVRGGKFFRDLAEIPQA